MIVGLTANNIYNGTLLKIYHLNSLKQKNDALL